MKLKTTEIEKIVSKIIFHWKDRKLIASKVSDHQLENKLVEIFSKELELEDKLNIETEKVLEKFEKQFESGDLDRRKMFSMVKAQLAKEKKIIL